MNADSLESAHSAGEVYSVTRDILALLVSLRTTMCFVYGQYALEACMSLRQ
jgi:hypothetical protein